MEIEQDQDQGVTLVTLVPTGASRLGKYFTLRWILRYRAVHTVIRRFKGRSRTGAGPSLLLEALNFIHFGRWIMLHRHPWRKPGAQGLPRFEGQPPETIEYGVQLFTSNFDNKWPAYVDTFMEAAEDDLGIFWDNMPGWGSPTKLGYDSFFELVDRHSVPHLHYYSAFPRYSTADIKSALAVDRHVRSFHLSTASYENDSAWKFAFDLLVSQLQHSLGTIDKRPSAFSSSMDLGDEAADSTGGTFAGRRQSVDNVALTSFAPLPAGRAKEVTECLREYTEGHVSPFSLVEGTHFARLTLVATVQCANKEINLASGYMLLSADADGSPGGTKAWLGKLFDEWSQIHPSNGSDTLIDVVWGSCYGFGPGLSKQQFLEYIARTEFKPTVPFADYPRTTVWDINRALSTHAWFTDLVFDSASCVYLRRHFTDLMIDSLPVDPPVIEVQP